MTAEFCDSSDDLGGDCSQQYAIAANGRHYLFFAYVEEFADRRDAAAHVLKWAGG
jgi:hypothetical protein